MRIIQMIQKPQRRGPEIFSVQLADILRKKGHEVQIISLYPYSGDAPLSLGNKDSVLSGEETNPLEKLLGFHPQLLLRLVQGIDKFQPDIVQVNGSRTIKYGSLAKLISRTNGKRWVLIYRNIDDPCYWVRGLLRTLFYTGLIMPHVDGVAAVSKQMLQNVKSKYHLQVPSVFIPHAIDPSALQIPNCRQTIKEQHNISEEVKIILFMGNLCDQKRPDRFLRIIRRIADQLPKIEAWVLGDGPLRKKLEMDAREMPKNVLVRFWGYQSQIAPFIMDADIHLVTSDSDGIPAVILAAGFLGKPTVATCVGGIPECVIDGKTGILTQPNDEATMAASVLNLLLNEKRRSEMGKEARELVLESFIIEKVAGMYLSFYKDVLGI